MNLSMPRSKFRLPAALVAGIAVWYGASQLVSLNAPRAFQPGLTGYLLFVGMLAGPMLMGCATIMLLAKKRQ